MEKKTNSDSLQKTKNFREKQESIIKSISKKCTKSTFIETIQSDETQIKHFKFEDGTHVYSVNSSDSSKPSRLISSTELPNIKYFANHWNPMLVPDKDLSQVNGTYIYINPNCVSYTSFIDGKILFEAGYNFNLNNTDKTNFFCNFGYKHYGKTFNELPKNVETILQLLENRYNLYGTNYPRLVENYKTSKNILTHLENNTVYELHNNENDSTKIVESDIAEPPVIVENFTSSQSSSISDNQPVLKSEELALPLKEQDFRTSIKVVDYIQPSNTSISCENNCIKHTTLKTKLLGLLKKHSTPSRDDE